MISTIVLDAPAGIGGPGRVRASGSLRSTALPWVALVARACDATGAAMTAGAVAVPQEFTGEPLATTNPYSTLGNHSPGRPQS